MADPFKAECGRCGGARNAAVLGLHRDDWSSADGEVSGSTEYRILQCLGCDAFYFHERTQHTENIDYEVDPVTGQHEPFLPWEPAVWPPVQQQRAPEWLPRLWKKDTDLANILGEAYAARAQNMLILPAIGLRTALDRAAEVLGVDPAKTFPEKLTALQVDGRIGETERMALAALAEAGHGAAHRGWQPDREQLDHLFKTLELFIERAFLNVTPEELRRGVPPKPARRQPAEEDKQGQPGGRRTGGSGETKKAGAREQANE